MERDFTRPAILALGLAIGGYFAGNGFVRAKGTERFVTVKGVSEREAPADPSDQREDLQHHRDRARRQLNALTTVADEARCGQRRGQAQDDRRHPACERYYGDGSSLSAR